MADGKVFHTAYLGNELLVAQNLKSFEVVYDIEKILPKGILTLNDSNGNYLKSFKGLEIGSEFILKFVPNDKMKQPIKFGQLVNIGIGDNPTDHLTLQGNIELLLGHPWELYKDFSSHIYKGMSNSKIIQEVLKKKVQQDQEHFEDIYSESESDLIKNSDEDGSIPRFQCGISDYDFIKKRVLPYTTLNNSPAFFWIGEDGKAHLNSFENMFTQNPKALLVPKSQGNIKADKENINMLMSQTDSDELILYEGLLIKVGDEDISKLISPLRFTSLIDGNTTLGTVFKGEMKPKLKIGPDTLTRVGSKLPLFAWTMDEATTDLKVFSNRNIKDVSRFSINSTRQFINMFRMEMNTSFCGDTIHAGDTVLVYVKQSENGETEGKKLSHWLSDRWLVSKVRHYYSDVDTNLYSQLTLCRPTFYVAKTRTEMPNIDFYYGD